MKWNEDYANFVEEVSLPTTNNYVYVIGQIAGEAGECSAKFAKAVRDEWSQQELDDALFKEMGDLLWHIQKWANMNAMTLEDIANGNMYKLKDRVKRDQIRGSGDER